MNDDGKPKGARNLILANNLIFEVDNLHTFFCRKRATF